ncbi:MAG: addiction module protein [Bacteroidales bacterium]|nr:addiction module protein [Bacteroidales bacterium]
MEKNKNINPYNYQDDTMPCSVNDSGIDGEISDELKQLIDERLAAIENGTTEFISWEEAERECQLRLQAYRQKQHNYV